MVSYSSLLCSTVVAQIPSLRLLDYKKVTLQEREEAKALFSSKEGQGLAKKIEDAPSKTFVPGELGDAEETKRPSAEQVQAVKAAIQNAKSLDEIRSLEKVGRRKQKREGGKERGLASDGNISFLFKTIILFTFCRVASASGSDSQRLLPPVKVEKYWAGRVASSSFSIHVSIIGFFFLNLCHSD